MTRNELIATINSKQSFLCVGLDPDLKKIPSHLLDYDDPIYEFCKQIIDQTNDLAVAYKPNLAFFECLGPKGWQTLEKIKKEIPKHCFTIADAKRGDIGNTSAMYASTFFKYYDFDGKIYGFKNELVQAIFNILNNSRELLIEKIDSCATKYDLWLIAAGELGRIYPGLIKFKGGRAFDIGSLIDFWCGDGIPSRLKAYLTTTIHHPLKFSFTPSGKEFSRFI